MLHFKSIAAEKAPKKRIFLFFFSLAYCVLYAARRRQG